MSNVSNSDADTIDGNDTPFGSSVIADAAIISAKLDVDAVTAAKIAADAVDTTQLAADAVSESEIADNGTDGQVLTSAGGTGPAWESVATQPNEPDWTEDGNSPFTFSSVATGTCTLASSYDKVLLFFSGDNAGFDQMTVNANTTSDYFRRTQDASVSSGNSVWDFGNGTSRFTGLLISRSSYLSRFGLIAYPRQVSNSLIQYGEYNGDGTQISELEFTDSSGNARSLTVEVFGRNV